MLWMFIPYLLLGFMEEGAGVMQGLGYTVKAAGTSLVGSCVFRVVWLLVVFPQYPTLSCIFFSFPISWFFTEMAHFILSERTLRGEERK